MKKYLTIFNIQTLVILILSLLSAYISLRYELSIYLDFLILGLMIIFPLTFSLRSAFRRRERALQYLSLFKASLQSVYYAFQNSKLEKEMKNQFKNVAENISTSLLNYLSEKSNDAKTVQEASHSIFIFIASNKIKRALGTKVLMFIFRTNECIEFLLATRRHKTPWGPRALVLFAIYGFSIFYPASLLHDVGFNVPLWYVFVMTFFKTFLLISLYNVEALLEDPFNQTGTDGIRIYDFAFDAGAEPPSEIKTAAPEDELSEIMDEHDLD